ncbi:MAG TPA: HAD family acid phosphatase [Methanosarcina sp.]|nr:HAD family acid phosphatase [Methanosarcina sp.]
MTSNTQKRIAIFDLDGTLCDHSHRIHLVSGKKKDFDKYHDLCPIDPPNESVVASCKRMGGKGVPIVLMTGRPDSHRQVTEDWLRSMGIKYQALHMRPAGKFMKSKDMKLNWVNEYYGGIGNVVSVFEDKKDVVDMWVEQKVPFVHALPDLSFPGETFRLYSYGKEVKMPQV